MGEYPKKILPRHVKVGKIRPSRSEPVTISEFTITDGTELGGLIFTDISNPNYSVIEIRNPKDKPYMKAEYWWSGKESVWKLRR